MKKLHFLLFLLLPFLVSAQNPGDIAHSFGTFPGFTDNGSKIYVITPLSDGKILVGGFFISYNGAHQGSVIRLNTDGTKDTSFNIGAGIDGSGYSVRAITQQADGKILIVGVFQSFNGAIENNIIRLNADGTKDTSFITGTGFNDGPVYAIKQQADGKILVGGSFASYNGTTERSIVRLNADGTKDTSFITGYGFLNSQVYTIELQADGKILVGGSFTSYNLNNQNRIVRLNADGTKDTSFNIGNDAFVDGQVNTIELQTDGKILVGGSFTVSNGTYEKSIIRLNTNGTKDTSFITGTGFNERVDTITLQADGKILVGGGFTSYNGVTENRIIRLNVNGTKDASFITGTGFNQLGVSVIATQADGKILAGGDFTSYNGTDEYSFIRINTDGTRESSFNTGIGFNKRVNAIVKQTDGKILVGGDFTYYKGTNQNRIIRLNDDGTKDTSFNIGTGFDNTVFAIAQQADGKILVGGSFVLYNGASQNSIIRLNTDGTKDSSFNIGDGFNAGTMFNNNKIFTIEPQADGKILIGGEFRSFNGATENRIIRLNADGTKDSSFITGTGFSTGVSYEGYVKVIKLQADGKILVGGDFTSYNGAAENRIIRLNTDGTKDSSFITGTGFAAGSSFNKDVFEFVPLADGKILVGGSFTSYNGTPVCSIIRLNADGTKDSSFNPGNGFNQGNSNYNLVSTIEAQIDGKILVGGAFTYFNEPVGHSIIRLNADGTKDFSFNPGTGLNGYVIVMITLTDGKILLGGEFTSYNGDNSSAFLIASHSNSILSNNDFANSNTISLSPNPTKEILNVISLNNDIISIVKIYDLQGKLVLESLENSINVSSLSSGMYIIKINTDKSEITKKFIKD